MTIILNKPTNYNSDNAIEFLDPTLRSQVRLFDHLDRDTEGLLVFSDSKKTDTLSSEYEITIDQYLSRQAKNILTKGLAIEGSTIPGIEIIEEKHKGKRSVVHLQATQTTDTQLRTMFETIGYHVVGIRRIKLGEYSLGVLSVGRWKQI